MTTAPLLPTATYVTAIRAEAAAMAAAVDAGRERPVAACPGWDVGRLAVHTGEVLRWAAEIVRTAPAERPPRREEADPADPGLAAWLLEGAAQVAAALEATDPATPMWTMGEPRTAAFWGRRQAVEVLVHRWDAEDAATGRAQPPDPDLAADGVDELLSVYVPRLHRRSGVTSAGETFHFHRTDGPGEWLVRFGPEGVVVSAEHAKGDVALRGAAGDLLLALWRRRPLDSVEVFGDADRLARWRELVPAI